MAERRRWPINECLLGNRPATFIQCANMAGFRYVSGTTKACFLTGSGRAFFGGMRTRGGRGGGRATEWAGGHDGRCRAGGLGAWGVADGRSAGSGAGGGLGLRGLASSGPKSHEGSGSESGSRIGGGFRPEVLGASSGGLGFRSSGSQGMYSGSR